MVRFVPALVAPFMLVLAACSSQPTIAPTAASSDDAASGTASAAVSQSVATETAKSPVMPIPASFRAIGTEPFWSASVEGETLTWSSPEQAGDVVVPVIRTDGDGKATVSGMLEGRPLQLDVRYATCSDGMSDTVYPLSVTRRLGSDVHEGCAR